MDNVFIRIIFNKVIRIAVGVLIVLIGIKLIKGKKKELDNSNDLDDTDE